MTTLGDPPTGKISMTDPISYRLQQILPDGTLWTSSESYERDTRHAAQSVLAGFLCGQPRAAVEEGTGRVIFAVDAKGRATTEAVQLFGTVEKVAVQAAAPVATARARRPR
jgi:hypothetical protein